MRQFYCNDCLKVYRKKVWKCDCGCKDIKPIEINLEKNTVREL